MKPKKQMLITSIFLSLILIIVTGKVSLWIYVLRHYDDGTRCMLLNDRVIISDDIAVLLLIMTVLFTIFIYICVINIVLSMICQYRDSKEKEDYVNRIVHDFRTPITTINIGCQVLMEIEENRGAEEGNYLKVISEEAGRLNFMTEQILNLMRIKEVVVSDNMIDIHEVIKDVINSMSIIISSSRSVIIENLNASNHFVKGDKSCLKSVFVNLIDNAIKYNESLPTINIITSNDANKLIIKIIDNGIGLSREDCRKIFRRAYRVSSKDAKQLSGFGFGLYNVKRIIDELSGNISIDSQLGKGTTFIISLSYNKPP